MLSPDNNVQTPGYTQNFNRYSYALNNPLRFTDPDGEFVIVPILIGAAIGALVSGATTIVTNAIAGNNIFQGIGKSMLMGALGASISGAFAGTAFGQSTGFAILNNVASNAATSAAFGQDITLGSIAGSIAGGFIAGRLPQFTGVKGGSAVNAVAELGHKSLSGAVTGAIGGGIGAAVDGKDIGQGMLNGAKNGAIGGAAQAGLNIVAMGAAYLPDDPDIYGDFGSYVPIYRRGTFITNTFAKGGGISLGRNLVTNLRGMTAEYGDFLRAHETAHFLQQRILGFGEMYRRTIQNYLDNGMLYSYYKPGTLEWGANMYSLHRIGYYFTPFGKKISVK